MKKLISLINAVMSSDMELFKVKSKNKNSKFLPIILAFFFMFYIWIYANMLMDSLLEVHQEVVLLTIFILVTTILTLIEGVYKSSSLLFNCKDDDLLLSLPLRKSTVLFIRIFKFYVFELIYNSLFLIPSMVVYIRYINVDLSFYLISLLMLILLPIIPVILSAIIGLIISSISSRFKHKNIIQIIFTFIILIAVFYFVSMEKNIMSSIALNATNINDFIIKVYYPAGVYINSITNFNIVEFLIFILINIAIFCLSIMVFSNIYYKINSKTKEIGSKTNKNTNYVVKTKSQYKSLISKELKKFISSPVLVTNAGLGLVLHVIACVLIVINYDKIILMFTTGEQAMSVEKVMELFPCLFFGLLCFSSFMTVITCSLISLEGKSFNILKSLPVSPMKIIMSKVYTALLIMIPFILLGDIILFIRFDINLIQIILLLITSFVLPILSEVLGILFNLKYPKMDISNDAEAVKQSTSTMLSTFVGMGLAGIGFVAVMIFNSFMGSTGAIIMCLSLFTILTCIALFVLIKVGSKLFNRITV